MSTTLIHSVAIEGFGSGNPTSLDLQTFLTKKYGSDVTGGLDLDPEDVVRGEIARGAPNRGLVAGLLEAELRRPHHHPQRPGHLYFLGIFISLKPFVMTCHANTEGVSSFVLDFKCVQRNH